MTRARRYHLLTGAVAVVAVVLQLLLVWHGNRVLDESSRPDLDTRLIRFASYLTIWGNVLVGWSSGLLARGREPGSRWARALRLDAVVLIAVIAVVHFFFLRPLLHLEGADRLADTLLHIVVPLLAVVGWLVVGPRRYAAWSDVPLALVLPVVWMAYTLLRGEITGWYPYPFIDVGEHGYGRVLLACLGVGGLMAVGFALAVRLDAVLSSRGAGTTAKLGR